MRRLHLRTIVVNLGITTAIRTGNLTIEKETSNTTIDMSSRLFLVGNKCISRFIGRLAIDVA